MSRDHGRSFALMSRRRTLFLLSISANIVLGFMCLHHLFISVPTTVSNEAHLSRKDTVQLKTAKSYVTVKPSTAAGTEHPTVKKISLLGERNSGTRWTSSHLMECFGSQVEVDYRLVRHKHWFQHDVVPGVRVNRTLVIAQFRDPIYWVDAMRRKPHHAPMHHNKKWSTFVKIPWTLPKRPAQDEQFVQDLANNRSLYETHPCHENFEPHQIIACLRYPFPSKKEYTEYFQDSRLLPSFSGQLPRYELKDDGSGDHYNNILEMRADKIRNFLSIKDWDWIEEVYVVQYEKLVKQGTAALIAYIEDVTGLKAQCTPTPPQQDRPSSALNSDFVNWMNKHVDWEAEKMIGYDRWNLSASQ